MGGPAARGLGIAWEVVCTRSFCNSDLSASMEPEAHSHRYCGTACGIACEGFEFSITEVGPDQLHRDEGHHSQTASSESFPQLVDSLVSNCAQETPSSMLVS